MRAFLGRLPPTPWPAAAALVVLSLLLFALLSSSRPDYSTLTGTTTGTIVDGTTQTESGRNTGTVCRGTLVYSVDGVERRTRERAPGKCSEDGTSTDVTVHYDPAAPSRANTTGPQTGWLNAGLWLVGALAVFAALLLVHSLWHRRLARATDAGSPKDDPGPPR